MAANEDFSVLERGLDLIGVRIEDRYEVASVLGSGGFGTVYRAMDRRSYGREVVVKMPHLHMLGLEGFRKRFEREIQSLLRLEHPHIVKVLDTGSHRGVPYVVLQYLEGGSLVERLAQGGGRLKPEAILRWLPAVAETLDFIHRRGYVHRDLKPANILFDAEGHVFLTDFGIAKALAGLDTQLTQAGGIPGSAKYMGPEALQPDTIGPAYDQYALGVVVYEALCGRLPHEAGSALQLLVQKSTRPPAPLEERPAVAPPRAIAAVLKALAPEPRDRFASCAEFATAFADGCPSSTDSSRPQLGEVPARRRRALTRRLVLFGLVLAAFAGLVLARRGRVGREPVRLMEQRIREDMARAGGLPDASERKASPLQPLLTGPGLPGWLVQGATSWSPANGVLRLEAGASLRTHQSYADVAYAASVFPATAETHFGLGLRLEAGAPGVELEFGDGGTTLRAGGRTEALGFRWEPGRGHQILLMTAGDHVVVFLDRQKLADVRDPGLAASGKLGASCGAGRVELKWMYAQRLD